ncbi:hypothetical protein [Aurantibacillus circumpalustris]|uniref:hypothetical protein n=1 Tax=Aurantibacillus circumpalustris TaxID=3036359 RepID=UPI00295BE2F3|nr:hypothetical protein [Aurantibacillus circumpalustris]
MKNKFLFLTFGLIFITLNLNAQDQEEKYPETVLIKLVETVYEGASIKAESKLIIVKPDNSIETKMLERTSYLRGAELILNDNLIKTRIELQLWQNQGFELKGMSTTSPMDYLMITTFVMTKN